MTKFVHKALPWNIVFGTGALKKLPKAMDSLGLGHALVLCTPGQESRGRSLAELLDARAVGVFARARMHVPAETLAEASRLASELSAHCTVSVGGGSTTGLGKALAVCHGLPCIAVPTTYAGSEMTDIWAITADGKKISSRDPGVVPALTIYDPSLTLTLPVGVSAASGMNALAQAVVNVATDKPNPMAACLGLEAIKVLADALPEVVSEPTNLYARSEALYGACLAGGAIGLGSTSLHHRLCHTLGGAFGTPHAETHAILLPHCVVYNTFAAFEGTRKVARALGTSDAAVGIHELAKRIGAPTTLKQIGLAESDLDRAAETAVSDAVSNPEQVTVERVRALLQNAYDGQPPEWV